MNLVNYWYGAFGRYEIPKAIIWLADAANARIGLPSVTNYNLWRNISERDDTPGFKVIAEWGAWRDAEEEKRQRQEMAIRVAATFLESVA